MCRTFASIGVADTTWLPVATAPNLTIVAATDDGLGGDVDRARIVAGRAPRSAEEIAIGESLARQLHVGLGDHLDAQSFTPAQFQSVIDETSTDPGHPRGPSFRFSIVGIDRRPFDLGRRGALGGVVVLPPAFYRQYGSRVGSWGVTIRIRNATGSPTCPR